MNALLNKHPGETCHIVGKGPSLRYLQAKHFGAGPVIALNNAIVVVQDLGLTNPIYSLQKDGNPAYMVEPYAHIPVILQDTPGYSLDYFPEHPVRILVSPTRDLGFERPTIVAIRMAIALSQFIMGCTALKLLCCDNLVTGALETYNPRTGESKVTGAARFYQSSGPLIIQDLEQIEHEFIIPAGKKKTA